ncbi:MAG: hypothetical protein ACREGR_04650 [Minisyncoccia bacterium]
MNKVLKTLHEATMKVIEDAIVAGADPDDVTRTIYSLNGKPALKDPAVTTVRFAPVDPDDYLQGAKLMLTVQGNFEHDTVEGTVSETDLKFIRDAAGWMLRNIEHARQRARQASDYQARQEARQQGLKARQDEPLD